MKIKSALICACATLAVTSAALPALADSYTALLNLVIDYVCPQICDIPNLERAKTHRVVLIIDEKR